MTELTFNSRYISGMLLDGTPFSINAIVNAPAAINLINLPEPSSILLAALAGICLVACA